MPAGRPRLPRELKEFNRTINVTDEKKYEEERKAEKQLKNIPKAIFAPETKLPCPKSIKERYVRNYWKTLTGALIALGVIGPIDLPEVEALCVTLQKLREVQKTFIELDPFDEDFDLWEKRYIRLQTKFSELGAKYYVSPVARSKIRLDDLNIQKTQQELQKNETALSRLLENRK